MRRPRRELDGFAGFDEEVGVAEEQSHPAFEHVDPVLTGMNGQRVRWIPSGRADPHFVGVWR